LYLFIRELAGFFSIRIQGHTQFIRPIVNPMAQAAGENKFGELDEKDQEKIKARAAANENFGNVFAQNTFVAASGVVLIVGTLHTQSCSCNHLDMMWQLVRSLKHHCRSH